MTEMTKTLPLVLALALAPGMAFGQEPPPSEPVAEEPAAEEPTAQDTPASETQDEEHSREHYERRPDVVLFGSGYTLAEGDSAADVVVFGGDVVIAGQVTGDLVSMAGTLRLASTAVVEGDIVVVAGSATVEAGALAEREFVVVGGTLDAPDGFAPGGEQVVIGTPAVGGAVAGVLPWLSNGVLMGRPIVPDLGWVWGAVVLLALVYFAINIVFERPVRACVEAIAEKPATTFLAGVLVVMLVGPLTLVLMVSVIGLPVVPFLWLALLLAGLLGRVGVARWIGGKVAPETSPGNRFEAARALGIGLAALTLLYMVPLLGFATWATVSVLGMGAAAATFLDGLRQEHPKTSIPHEVGPQQAPFATPPDDVHTTGPLALATFGSRLGAVALDGVLIAIAAAFLDLDGPFVALVVLVYHIALWARLGTTVGGIICQIRLVRSDGSPPVFADALVRGLSAIFSVAVAGLGWFWILWDPNRQSWHDRIAGTFVVSVPPQAHPVSAPIASTDPPAPAAAD